jgi:hypothetical protein
MTVEYRVQDWRPRAIDIAPWWDAVRSLGRCAAHGYVFCGPGRGVYHEWPRVCWLADAPGREEP